MNHLYIILPLLYISVRSCVAINKHKHDSFLNIASKGTSASKAELDGPEEAPEPKRRAANKSTIEKIKALFKTEDKVLTKKTNNTMILEFEDYKNVRNKKEMDVHHLQVQKSNDTFTNNTDKGVLHFKGDLAKLAGKGTVTRATFKLNKLFDAKNLGFACKSNAVNVYLIESPADDLKLKTIKGPVKMEFKKDEVEVDISKFFDDLDDGAESGPAPNLTGAANLLQLNDLSRNDETDDIVFDENPESAENAEGEEDDDEFFGSKKPRNGEAGDAAADADADVKAPQGFFDKYLMLEADEGCYFAFDVEKEKPKVKIDLSKKVVNRVLGQYKTSSITFLGVGVVTLISLLAYAVKRRSQVNTFVFDNPGNEIMAGY